MNEDVAMSEPSASGLYIVEPVGAKLATPPIERSEPADVVAMPTQLEKYDFPATSKMLLSVEVDPAPTMMTFEVLVG